MAASHERPELEPPLRFTMRSSLGGCRAEDANYGGGALSIYGGARAVVLQSVLEGCTAAGVGGGVFVERGAVALRESKVRNCRAENPSNGGGGLYLRAGARARPSAVFSRRSQRESVCVCHVTVARHPPRGRHVIAAWPQRVAVSYLNRPHDHLA